MGTALAVVAIMGPLAAASPRAHPANPIEAQRAVIDRYCVTCHNEILVQGVDRSPDSSALVSQLRMVGLTLDTMDLAKVGENAATWEKVVRKLRTRAMPPQPSARPDEATYGSLTSWLETELDRAAAVQPNPGRRPSVHRLNRAEYANAIRDLLGLDIDGQSLLPPDDSGYGFDNIADVLSVSPMLTERYLSAARKIARLAVGDPTLRPTTETFAVDKYLRQDDRVSEDLPFGSRGGLAVDYFFPLDADYVVKIDLLRTYDGRLRGLTGVSELEVRLDGELVETLTVGGPLFDADGEPRRWDLRNSSDDGQEVRFSARAGPATLAVSYVGKASVLEGMRRPRYAVTSYEYAGDQTIEPGIASVELRGPYQVSGRGDTPSRRQIFVCRPSGPKEEETCANEILVRLARRAYRRPASEDEVEMLLEFYQAGRSSGDFDAGIEMALRRVLVSPSFLFRTEDDPSNVPAGTAYRISDFELASRLSFFLWSSIPDEELLGVAERGQLKQPEVLEAQVRRMLADRRSQALVSNFGGQWLYLRNMQLVSPDSYAYSDFDRNLRQAMEREMELFFESQIREDHGVPDLLTADYTFVNQRLAEHYGIPNIYGNHFRRVTLSGENDMRRGLLGKGSLLTVTSYAHRTSPVVRGKWLLENVLGTPPPPPPPDVPALDENTDTGLAPRSMRERLEAHRANPVCASCHKIMDPLGFALENFDGIGRWRTTSAAGTPIDAAGRLVDGTEIDGPASLRRALLNRPEDFVTTVTEKLITYALGRGVEYYDGPAVRRVVREAAGSDYRWSSLILGIIESTPFQMRRSKES